MLEALFSFEGLTAGTSTAAALLLYKIQRDVADLRKDMQRSIESIEKDQAGMRAWIDRMRRRLWPDPFSHD
jgi:hypothetical protein